MSFLQKLDNLPAFHHVVKALRLRDAAGAMLRRFPRVRHLPKTGAVYRCRYLETLLLADELFKRNVYLKAIDPAKVQTFADLGANVGLFAVLLLEMTGRRDLRGLMIDANPEMIAETTWHLDQNRLPGVKPVHGLAGSASTGESVDFFILPSNLGSSQFAVYEPGKPPKGEWKKISVPRVDLETAWLRDVGDVRCHFCKIDIEGSEKQLLQTDQRFLARVDTIILEWHKWIAQREELDKMLADQGFRLVEVLEDLAQTGIAWYAR